MTQPKGRPAIAPKKRRPNYTISTSQETKAWLDNQPCGRGHAIDALLKFCLSHQPEDTGK